jgi:phi13 family phage major tail protein
MAAIGLRKIKYAKYAENAGVVTYSGGRSMGESISADLSIEIAEAILYTEDAPSEDAKEFAGGTLSFGVKELDYTTQADLYGHTRTPATTGANPTPESLKSNKDDTAGPVGAGFCVPVMRSGVKKFRAIFFNKLVFSIPGLSFKSKEKTITFSTPTTVGTLLTAPNGDWKDEAMCDTIDQAEDWIDAKLGISA